MKQRVDNKKNLTRQKFFNITTTQKKKVNSNVTDSVQSGRS
jgi:hypothetical protein